MPFWIPFLIIAAGSALAGAAVIAAIALIIDALEDKKLAVLGERKVGKTVLINFLTKGTLREEYIQTLSPEKTESSDFKLKDLRLRIKESIDVPGEPDFYAQWKELSRDADIVLYLLRTDKLMEGDEYTVERVKKDMGQIGRWLKENPKKLPLFIIGTYCDLTTPDLTTLTKDKLGDYEDKLRSMPILREIALLGGGGRNIRFIFGSLKSKDDTERLVYRIIEQVVNQNG